jgi:hypothetical protein
LFCLHGSPRNSFQNGTSTLVAAGGDDDEDDDEYADEDDDEPPTSAGPTNGYADENSEEEEYAEEDDVSITSGVKRYADEISDEGKDGGAAKKART